MTLLMLVYRLSSVYVCMYVCVGVYMCMIVGWPYAQTYVSVCPYRGQDICGGISDSALLV